MLQKLKNVLRAGNSQHQMIPTISILNRERQDLHIRAVRNRLQIDQKEKEIKESQQKEKGKIILNKKHSNKKDQWKISKEESTNIFSNETGFLIKNQENTDNQPNTKIILSQTVSQFGDTANLKLQLRRRSRGMAKSTQNLIRGRYQNILKQKKCILEKQLIKSNKKILLPQQNKHQFFKTGRNTLRNHKSSTIIRKNKLFFSTFLSHRQKQIQLMQNPIAPHINNMANVTSQIFLQRNEPTLAKTAPISCNSTGFRKKRKIKNIQKQQISIGLYDIKIDPW